MVRGPMHTQRGAALVIALLAVALAAVMAVELIERGQRDVARTTAIVAAERAWQFAEGIEGLARDWIRDQRELGFASRALDGQWSEPFPVPGGSVRGRMFALDGKFNLNALASRDPAVIAAARRSLARLLAELDVDPALGADIVSMFRPGADGVSVRLAHVSELNRLERYNRSARGRLADYLAVLPDPGASINVNRAEPEVLAAVVDGLGPDAARSVLSRAPFETLDEVMAQPEFAALNSAGLRKRLAVDSQWFLVHGQVTLDGVVRDYFRLVGVGGNRYDFRYLSQGIP